MNWVLDFEKGDHHLTLVFLSKIGHNYCEMTAVSRSETQKLCTPEEVDEIPLYKDPRIQSTVVHCFVRWWRGWDFT